MAGLIDRLWYGWLSSVSMSLLTLEGHIVVEGQTSNGSSEIYVIKLHEIKELRFLNEVSMPWVGAEIGSAYLTEEGEYQILELEVWSEPSALVIKCKNVEICEL